MENLDKLINESEVISLDQWDKLPNKTHVGTSSVHDDNTYFEYWKSNNTVYAIECRIPTFKKSIQRDFDSVEHMEASIYHNECGAR